MPQYGGGATRLCDETNPLSTITWGMAFFSTCTKCDGFVTGGACPNCGARAPAPRTRSVARRLLRAGGAVGGGALAFTLMACYGMPPCNEGPSVCGDDPMADAGRKVDAGQDGSARPDASDSGDAGEIGDARDEANASDAGTASDASDSGHD